MPKHDSRLSKLEQRAAPAKVHAYAVVDSDLGEQVTGDTECSYWVEGKRRTTTKSEFERLYPEGELTVIKIVYAPEEPGGHVLRE